MALPDLDFLSDEELEALEIVLKDFKSVRENKIEITQKVAVRRVDSILKKASEAPKGLIFYRNYEESEELIGDGIFTEPGFLVGVKKEKIVPGSVSFEFKIDSEIPYIDLGDTYLFPRGLSVAFSRIMDPDVNVAKATDRAYAGVRQVPKTLTASMMVWSGPDPISKFHLKGQHDQSAHGTGGGGATRVPSKVPSKKTKKKKKLTKTQRNLRINKLLTALSLTAYIGLSAYSIYTDVKNSRKEQEPLWPRTGGQSGPRRPTYNQPDRDFINDVRKRNADWRANEAAARNEQAQRTREEFRRRRGPRGLNT